ncbi:P60-like protein [Wallemia mellicola]|uniref:Ribosome biogenesis protein NOP53 n=1 Tax=Wallemia mellicola TaxID=1708541 RepID=A0A4T0NGJ4_9BASI|nr:P60-like protein [Wallemia mellicola]
MPKVGRKGKKEWRKNVNTEDLEANLESLREEQKVYGTKLDDKADKDLFQVDIKGDEGVRKRVKKEKKPLKSLSILSQRSAIPAPSTKHTISSDDKRRLRAISKRDKGPLGASFKPQKGESIAAQGLTKAAKEAGKYNLWNDAQTEEQEVKDEIDNREGFDVVNLKRKPTVKVPSHPTFKTGLEPVEKPHAGQSYNPSSKEHEELLKAAYDKELQRKLRAEENANIRRRMQAARKAGGMELDIPDSDAEDVEEDDEEEQDDAEKASAEENVENEDEDFETKEKKRIEEFRLAKKKRKAALQLKKDKIDKDRSAFLKAQKHAITQAPGINKALLKKLRKQEERAQARKEANASKELGVGGLEGKKVGSHVVPMAEVDVQLGEDLSESLRGVKTEGNLFRDRFLSMQKRALIEPRQPVAARRKYKRKDYETPAFRFWEKR